MTWVTGLPGAVTGISCKPCETVKELLDAVDSSTPGHASKSLGGHIELTGGRLIAYRDKTGGLRGSYQDHHACIERQFTTKTNLAERLKEYAS